MKLNHKIKLLLATRSPSLLRNCNRAYNGTTASIDWHGRKVKYRPGTSDPNIIYHVLFKTRPRVEYFIPDHVRPEVILDIGGHIGCAALYFNRLFPKAKVYSFEPVADNQVLHEANTGDIENIILIKAGLGNADRTLRVSASSVANMASFSINQSENDDGPTREIQIVNAHRCLRDLGVERADIIKLDAEGAESEIIAALEDELLGGAQWITGELHNEASFGILNKLSTWYDLGVTKKYHQHVFMFEGARRSA